MLGGIRASVETEYQMYGTLLTADSKIAQERVSLQGDDDLPNSSTGLNLQMGLAHLRKVERL